MSEEVRQKQSLRKKGKITWNKGITWKKKNLFSRRVIQKDLDENIIKIWESIKKAKESLGSISIVYACRSPFRSAGGFKWEYYKKDN